MKKLDRVPMVGPMSCHQIECKAEDLLSKYAPAVLDGTSSFDVLEFCELGGLKKAFGVNFSVSSVGFYEGVEGRFDGSDIWLEPSVYDALGMPGNGRARFTLAHEVGHAALHGNVVKALNSPMGISAKSVAFYRKDRGDPIYRDPEWQANSFAASLLMPKAGVKQVVARYPNAGPHRLPKLLVEIFGVSWMAANNRLEKLRLPNAKKKRSTV